MDLLHFEDFQPGQVYALGRTRIEADAMVAFAREYDPQPQHLDPDAARRSILGGLAASGWYLCAIGMRLMVDGLLSRSTSLGSPGVEEVQWRKPVFAGTEIRFEGEVLETRSSSRPDREFVRMRFSMWRPDAVGKDERVMMFACSIMFGKRPSAIDGGS